MCARHRESLTPASAPSSGLCSSTSAAAVSTSSSERVASSRQRLHGTAIAPVVPSSDRFVLGVAVLDRLHGRRALAGRVRAQRRRPLSSNTALQRQTTPPWARLGQALGGANRRQCSPEMSRQNAARSVVFAATLWPRWADPVRTGLLHWVPATAPGRPPRPFPSLGGGDDLLARPAASTAAPV